MTDEQKLVMACQKHDPKSQKEVYNKYAPLMRGLCYRYVSVGNEIDDILQTGFVRIFVHIGKYTWQGDGSFVKWMKTVMINTAITYYRKNQRHSNNVYLDDLTPSAGCNDEEDGNDLVFGTHNIGQVTQSELMEILNTVPIDFRMVFNLHVIEGYKHEEIAEILNIKVETSRTRLLRAKRILQQKLAVLPK